MGPEQGLLVWYPGTGLGLKTIVLDTSFGKRDGRKFRVPLIRLIFFSFSTCAPVKEVRMKICHQTLDIHLLALIIFVSGHEGRSCP